MKRVETFPNPDLEVVAGNMTRWAHADERRAGWHGLHRLARYGLSFRAARVMRLEKRMNLAVASIDEVRRLTSLPWFSAMVVVQGQHILYENYARDFGPDRLHSIQSISKTLLNLVIGRLVDRGVLDLSRTVAQYIPEIGSGYASATLQQVINMDVVNDYSEDFSDPSATYWDHEEAMGWRLPKEARRELTQGMFLPRIKSEDTVNRSGVAQYKDASTAVMRWVAERASGLPFRAFLADIADAAGLESALHVTADREGVPTLEGGVSLTARDLARYFSIFARRGCGVDQERVGSESFIEAALLSGVPMPVPYEGIRYSNHLMVSGRAVGHGGWGGQYALANLDTGIIAVFLSVIENEHAINREYLPPVIRMLERIAGTADAR